MLRFYYVFIFFLYLFSLITGVLSLIFKDIVIDAVESNVIIKNDALVTDQTKDIYINLHYVISSFLLVLFILYYATSYRLAKIINTRVANNIELSIYNLFVFLIAILCVFNAGKPIY